MSGTALESIHGAALTRRTVVAAAVMLLLCKRSFAQGADFSNYNDIAMIASRGIRLLSA